MNNNTKRPLSPADKFFNFIVFLIIAAVFGLGVYAVYGKISTNLENKAIQSGQTEQNLQTAADKKGMSVDEFIEEYGLQDSDVNKDTSINDMLEKLTVENYAKYNDKELDAFLDENGLKDKVSGDTPWTEAEALIPLGIYMGGDEQFAQMKEMYQLDDSLTAETPWGEAKDRVMAAAQEYQKKAASATPAPSAEATAEVTTDAESAGEAVKTDETAKTDEAAKAE